MTDAYIGEIRMFSGNYAPEGWKLCDGQVLSINGNEALFSLIGTTYGGDGKTSFNLPDLRGRVPIHMSDNYPIAGNGGSEIVTLTTAQFPAHTHTVNASVDAGDAASPANMVWANMNDYFTYLVSGTKVEMSGVTVSIVGENQPHGNMMPSLVINFIIATKGIYPV